MLESIDSSSIIERRKEKIFRFLKSRYNLFVSLFLGLIIYLSIKIRTRNLDGLRDITTGSWTLGPDLDPFLFLRWAKYIVENGSLFAIDLMRYSPLGLSTKRELLLHPYLIAWFHKFIATPFLGTESVTHSAVLYPVFFFALTLIAFFLFVKVIFVENLGKKNATLVALVASFFLSVIPSLLPRTIAGIPEKESAAFFFLFMTFYFFLTAWKSNKLNLSILFAIFSGLSTAGMALIWGGFGYIFLILPITVLSSFLFGNINNRKLIIYSLWLITSLSFMIPFSSRYSFIRLISSVTIGLPIIVLLLLIIHKILINFGLLKFLRISFLSKFPKQLTTLITGVILFGILSSLPFGPFGPSFIIDQIKDIKSNLVSPATSRLIQTVAENRQPFFSEWANNFGPLIFNFPILFWLFFIGSVYIFNRTIISFKKKDRFYLCFTYFLFLSSVIFSRYSQDSLFNGTNVPSLLFYSSGFLIFAYTLGYYYYSYYKNGLFNKIRKIDMSLVFLLVFSLLGLISARGAVRLIMVLSIPVSIIVSYFVISFSIKSFKKSNDNGFIKLIISIFLILALLWAGFQLYSQDYSNAGAYIPSPYTHQWQKAMSWVRSETPQNSVFGHWWDYGYWIQSIGERATVLDGGNSISYWNHMMGRYALTGKNSEEALEFLYSHNTTHFLIDSTDIGKYSAFSTIGSDINYDRASYLPIFLKDNSLTSEKKNSIVSVYKGGSYLDEDIIYENSSGERIFLPGNRAAIGGIMISRDRISGYLTGPPTGVFIYNDQQIYLPLRYAYSDEKLLDFGFGVEAGIFSFPKVSPNSFERNGAIIYLSKRTVKSNLARIYLYNEKNSGFNLVHSEDDLLVAELKKLNPEIKEDIIYYQGLRGPIKIWELDYPTDIEFKEEYLETHYPSELRIAS